MGRASAGIEANRPIRPRETIGRNGEARLEIGSERIEVSAGDNVFTPNGVPHGIENTSNDKILKVYMVGVERG